MRTQNLVGHAVLDFCTSAAVRRDTCRVGLFWLCDGSPCQHNVGHATLDFYVLCRLADLHTKDNVGHASLNFFTSWLCDRFSYPGLCWTCRVGLFYVQCRLHYSEMSGHAQNNVGHAMLDFFTSPAVFMARWSIFTRPERCWTCRLGLTPSAVCITLPEMSVRTQNHVGHAVMDACCVLCRVTIRGYDSRGVRQQGCKTEGVQDSRDVRRRGCKTARV